MTILNYLSVKTATGFAAWIYILATLALPLIFKTDLVLVFVFPLMLAFQHWFDLLSGVSTFIAALLSQLILLPVYLYAGYLGETLRTKYNLRRISTYVLTTIILITLLQTVQWAIWWLIGSLGYPVGV